MRITLTGALGVALWVGLAVMASPVHAGTLSFVNGQGVWTSTACGMPQGVGGAPQDPETPADNLNARSAGHAPYVHSVEASMNCVAQEAEHDARVSGQIILQEAQILIQKLHAGTLPAPAYAIVAPNPPAE
jgi:hypothetical protein